MGMTIHIYKPRAVREKCLTAVWARIGKLSKTTSKVNLTPLGLLTLCLPWFICLFLFMSLACDLPRIAMMVKLKCARLSLTSVNKLKQIVLSVYTFHNVLMAL